MNFGDPPQPMHNAWDRTLIFVATAPSNHARCTWEHAHLCCSGPLTPYSVHVRARASLLQRAPHPMLGARESTRIFVATGPLTPCSVHVRARASLLQRGPLKPCSVHVRARASLLQRAPSNPARCTWEHAHLCCSGPPQPLLGARESTRIFVAAGPLKPCSVYVSARASSFASWRERPSRQNPARRRKLSRSHSFHSLMKHQRQCVKIAIFRFRTDTVAQNKINYNSLLTQFSCTNCWMQ